MNILNKSKKSIINKIQKQNIIKEQVDVVYTQEAFDILVFNNEHEKEIEQANLIVLNQNSKTQYKDKYIQLAE